MKIISWDVGILHLAYCVINTEDKSIIDWNNINLLELNERTCHGFIDSSGNKSICNKPPKFTFQNGHEELCFCQLHKNQFQKIEKNNIEVKKYKGEELCQVKKSNSQICNKSCDYEILDGDKKKYLCKFHYNLFEKKNDNNTIKKITKQNASKASIDIIKKNMINILDSKKELLNVDYVLIENQPSMKNPKMKSVAETLYCWFLIRGMKDTNKIKKIFYLSPSNKLKTKDENINKEISKIEDSSKKYKFTKNTAVIHTTNLIKDNEKWLDFLKVNKKKDDLCDSFLQGLYFIENINKFV
tara:strand:- start:84 stop:980 length:897 start_codon:yes stop_codon:yes gene_type:complete